VHPPFSTHKDSHNWIRSLELSLTLSSFAAAAKAEQAGTAAATQLTSNFHPPPLNFSFFLPCRWPR